MKFTIPSILIDTWLTPIQRSFSLRKVAPNNYWARRSRIQNLLALVTISSAFGIGASAFGQLAKEPLLARSSPVAPNLLFVLDNSGSMGGSVVEALAYARAAGACGNGAIASNSPYVNLLRYDPQKRYLPTRTNAGDPGANAVVDNTSTVEIYLPIGWNDSPPFTTSIGRFNPNASLSRVDICNATNYVGVQVGTGATVGNPEWRVNIANAGWVTVASNPFGNKSPSRIDCAAAICTHAEERQNIANWRAYHRTRQLAARSGAGEAFSRVPTTFRLGWGDIYATTAGNFSVMNDFPNAKNGFYTWLNGLALLGGTPLRASLNAAGLYYSQDTNAGPWGNTPANPGSETSASHLSCRKSFTILVTDGEWNGANAGTAVARADVDGVTGPTILHADGVKSFQYVPRSTAPMSIGKADRTAGATYSDTLSDVAMYYWLNDLRTDLPNNVSAGGPADGPFWQNMQVYTAAFGPVGRLTDAQAAQARAGALNWSNTAPVSNSAETIDDLIHTAHNAGGKFLTLTDAESFANQLGEVIKNIADQQLSQAGVAASAVSLTAGTKKFVPTFNPNGWWGNMRTINLNADGTESNLAWEVIATTNGLPTGSTTIATPSARNVYVWSNFGNKAVDFTQSALIGQGLISASATASSPILMTNTTSNDLINFIRGNRTREGDLSTDFRKRTAVLGDITNSTPAFAKDFVTFDYSSLPALTLGRSSWPAYVTTKSARTEGVLFVGANDGMVHVFREGITGQSSPVPGAEVAAFIPRGVLGKLHKLSEKPFVHEFFVDGPLSQHEAYINAPRNNASGTTLRWANVVAGTLGAGGRSVFAIDASAGPSMTERAYMWEANSAMAGFGNLGHVLNSVEMGILSNGTWVAIFNNGFYGDDGRASLFVVDLATGALIREIATDTLTSNGLGGVRVLRDKEGFITGAYAGDLRGRMWRFNLSDTSPSSWLSELLFTTSSPSSTATQPITAAPALFKQIRGRPGYMVVFGTGKLFDDADQSSTGIQSAYGIWDTTFIGTPTVPLVGRSQLVATSVVQTTNTATFSDGSENAVRLYNTTQSRTVDFTIDRGWVLDYGLASGQRQIYPVERVTSALVRIDSIAPRLNAQACTASASTAFNYTIDPFAGACQKFSIFDTNADGKIDANDLTSCIYSTNADGNDVVLPASVVGSGGVSGGGPESCSGDACLEQCLATKPIEECYDCRTLVRLSASGALGFRSGRCESTTSGNSTFRRDWRQLFMRP
jgi:type IV pilus assembly protein PilY1